MKPDWTKAPPEATRWDTKHRLFCDEGGWWLHNNRVYVELPEQFAWSTDRYTPRPVESKDETELEDCSSKTEELIMIEPDWTKAPEEATQWDKVFRLFCNASGWWNKHGLYFVQSGHNGWDTDRYTPRPVDSKDKTEELTR